MQTCDIDFIYHIQKTNKLSIDLAIQADLFFTNSAIISYNSLETIENPVIKCLTKHIINRLVFLKFLISEFYKHKNLCFEPKEINFIAPKIEETFIEAELIDERILMESSHYPDKNLQNILYSNYTFLRKIYYYIEVVTSAFFPYLTSTQLEHIILYGVSW